MPALRTRYNGAALVTGSSSGIGAEFARQLAAQGFDLVLVARRRDRLDSLATTLRNAHEVKVTVLAQDLLQHDAIDALKRETEAVDVGLVVLNAATITVGPFLENSIEEEEQMLALNSIVPLKLAHYFGAKLAARGRGGLLFVSSVAGNIPAPFQANYAASKAYVSSLGLGLHFELAPSGVDVTVLMPGPTSTEALGEIDGFDPSKLPVGLMTPDAVAKAGLDALGKKAWVVPGQMNKFADALGKYVMPRTFAAKMSGSVVSKALGRR